MAQWCSKPSFLQESDEESKPKGGLFGGRSKASPDSPVGPQSQKKIDSKLVDAKPIGKQVGSAALCCKRMLNSCDFHHNGCAVAWQLFMLSDQNDKGMLVGSLGCNLASPFQQNVAYEESVTVPLVCYLMLVLHMMLSLMAMFKCTFKVNNSMWLKRLQMLQTVWVKPTLSSLVFDCSNCGKIFHASD